MSAKKIKIDIHVHSETSYDCLTTLEDFKNILNSNRLDKIAITDHSKIGLAFELKEIYGDRIIIGEEIMTTHGEIIGLFLHKEIPRGLSPEETIEEIRKQGGIVYIPHPFDKRRSGIFRYDNYVEILKSADIIETFNSRCFSQIPNQLAKAFAYENMMPEGVGSDAHNADEIGRSYLEMDDFSDAKEFLENIQSATLVKRKMRIKYIFVPTLSKYLKKLK